jgi:hypothetical protein
MKHIPIKLLVLAALLWNFTCFAAEIEMRASIFPDGREHEIKATIIGADLTLLGRGRQNNQGNLPLCQIVWYATLEKGKKEQYLEKPQLHQFFISKGERIVEGKRLKLPFSLEILKKTTPHRPEVIKVSEDLRDERRAFSSADVFGTIGDEQKKKRRLGGMERAINIAPLIKRQVLTRLSLVEMPPHLQEILV